MASVTLLHSDIKLLSLDDVRRSDDITDKILLDGYPVG